MPAPDGLLAALTSWHKDGVQKLTYVVDKHKAALSALIAQAEEEILELVLPLQEAEKHRLAIQVHAHACVCCNGF